MIGRALAAFIVVLAQIIVSSEKASSEIQPQSAPTRTSADDPLPTFNKDVAPILFEHCVMCHRPGEAAPFTLLSFADARPRAVQIARAIRTRHMPPWLPHASGPRFLGERRL